MTSGQRESDRDTISELFQLIRPVDENLVEALEALRASWGTGEASDEAVDQEVSGLLLSCIGDGLFSVEDLVQGFRKFSDDFFRRQIDFLRTSTYVAKDYAKVKEAVYDNDGYMSGIYYPALLLCYLAAPNYRHILRSLDQTIRDWDTGRRLKLLEIGVGHGLLLGRSLLRLPSSEGVGVDVSRSARRFSENLMRLSGVEKGRYEFRNLDLLHENLDERFGGILCCEVLEHVPAPEQLLQKITGLLDKGGRVFLTAAVRMESVDHITLFDSTGQLVELLGQSGLHLLREFSVPFVSKRPASRSEWTELLGRREVPVTFIAECGLRSG